MPADLSQNNLTPVSTVPLCRYHMVVVGLSLWCAFCSLMMPKVADPQTSYLSAVVLFLGSFAIIGIGIIIIGRPMILPSQLSGPSQTRRLTRIQGEVSDPRKEEKDGEVLHQDSRSDVV